MLAIARILRTGARLLAARRADRGLAPVIIQQIGHTIGFAEGAGFYHSLVEQNFRFAADSRRPALRHGTRPHRR
jgi:branched-chain amino acid transport system ATP-binding protein